MNLRRRSLLRAAGALAAGAALGPLIRVKQALGGTETKAQRVVIVGVAGGLRLRESLGMAEGATMPSLLGDVPLISGYGSAAAGAVRVAPEYVPALPSVLPPPRAVPLYAEGALITNLRYAEGAPGHLQGAACLASGYYNNLDNRADAKLPVPTLFELFRRSKNAPATDAWYLSVLPGFFRALEASGHPEFGARYGASWMSPASLMSPIVPIVTAGTRALSLTASAKLPTIVDSPEEAAAARRLSAIIDSGTPAWGEDGLFRASAADNAAIQAHLATIYGDPTYAAFYPPDLGIGLLNTDGSLAGTGDSITTYHATQVLARWKPRVTMISLFDVDAAHTDYNAHLLNQGIADACIAYLWDFIQSTPGLKDETALLVLPEHGRQLQGNGKNTDSLGRSGLDHGGGDDGDRDVFLLALGPDFKKGVYAPTGVLQAGRSSGRYETIDAVATAAHLLGVGELFTSTLAAEGARPGLVIEDIFA
jgi:hypothetical protein